MKQLSRPDEILLVSILCLGDDAYSTTILEEVGRRAGKALTVGSLWVSLDHLAARGYLRKTTRRVTRSRGGRPRVYYRMTPKGIRALRRLRELQKALWDGVPEMEESTAAKGRRTSAPDATGAATDENRAEVVAT